MADREFHPLTQDHLFKTGDNVVLNSGGPSMVVVGFDDYRVEVAWTNDFGELEQHWFPEVCVRRVPE